MKQAAEALKPRLSKIAVLTAALQEPPGTSRKMFEEDPRKAAVTATLFWIGLAKRLGVHLQLGAALARPDAYVPKEAMLDPVASHLAVRTRKDGTGEDLTSEDAQAIIGACGSEVQICDIGFFDNPLHHDAEIRRQVHVHTLRCARAARMLAPVGCGGVTGFVGRNFLLDMDQNLALFEQEFIPLLKRFKEMRLKFWVEPCPMPGWTTTDMFVHNIAYCAGMWIRLYRICEKHGVQDVFRVTYDESHDILMGTTHHASFAAVKAAGIPVIDRTHGKNQYRNPAKAALWSIRGQMVDLGCRIDGKPHPEPAKQGGAWGVMACSHGQIGIGNYNPVAMVQGLEADWFDHQYALRSVLGLDPEQTYVILEHEWGPARKQDAELIEQMLQISVAYIRGIDAAADALYRSRQWCEDRGLPLPGSPNPMYNIPGLAEEAGKIAA